MRGYLMARFLDAPATDTTWFSKCDLKQDQAVSAIKDSIKQWNEVYKITSCLNGKENAEIRKHFTEAHHFFADKIKASAVTSSLAKELNQ